jgi:hypothetical protein
MSLPISSTKVIESTFSNIQKVTTKYYSMGELILTFAKE